MIGKKGKFEISTTAKLIIGIAVLIVVVIFFFGYLLPFLGEDVFGWLTKGNVVSAEEAVVLEEAIRCSFYRCVYGCEDDRIIDTDYFKCKSDFCSGKSGKICGKDEAVSAFVSESKGEKVSKNKIDDFVEKTPAIGFKISDTDNCQDRGNLYGLYFDKNDILDSIKGGCETINSPSPCYTNVLLSPGPYIVWTSELFVSAQPSGGNTIVCGE